MADQLLLARRADAQRYVDWIIWLWKQKPEAKWS
jgi:hypothetical protein